MFLKLSKKVHFLRFCAEFSKKSKFIKAIYIFAFERSCYPSSRNCIVYCALTYCFKGIRVLVDKFCETSSESAFFFVDISIVNNSWKVAYTPINHIKFWMNVMRTFRSIYVNYFHRLSFFTETSTKLQKCTFLYNLGTITQEANTENRQVTPFFSSTFSTLFACNIHFSVWK